MNRAGPVRLGRDFYRRDSRLVAPDLLNKVLCRTGPGNQVRSGRIVEVEAYCGAIDAGSHAYRGRTRRNATMFGPAGHLYVYFTYGMHHCANATCGEEGQAMAVLIRALAPVDGVDYMSDLRPRAVRTRDLTNGPAKLCQALGLDRSFDGVDLVDGGAGICILDAGAGPPARPANGVRIGLSAGREHPWRWWVDGDEHVSRRG